MTCSAIPGVRHSRHTNVTSSSARAVTHSENGIRFSHHTHCSVKKTVQAARPSLPSEYRDLVTYEDRCMSDTQLAFEIRKVFSPPATLSPLVTILLHSAKRRVNQSELQPSEHCAQRCGRCFSFTEGNFAFDSPNWRPRKQRREHRESRNLLRESGNLHLLQLPSKSNQSRALPGSPSCQS